MKRILYLLPLLLLMTASCVDHDDFAFSGTVVDYEECTSMFDFGYAIALTSPDTVGTDYVTRYGKEYHNVVVAYGADRILHENETVAGRMYLDPNYSHTQCNYHYDREAPDACFTDLE